MNRDVELMQQALEALESLADTSWTAAFKQRKYDSDEPNENVERERVLGAITALRERLSNPTPEQLYNDINAGVPGVSLKAHEALRVLSLALGESPAMLTPKQRHAWEQARKALLSLGGCA